VFKNLPETWDLDVFFPGGSHSKEFAAFLDCLEADVRAFRDDVSGGVPQDLSGWVDRIILLQDLTKRLRQSGAFISCLNAQDVGDRRAGW
jgi:oligoendopeptidase F